MGCSMLGNSSAHLCPGLSYARVLHLLCRALQPPGIVTATVGPPHKPWCADACFAAAAPVLCLLDRQATHAMCRRDAHAMHRQKLPCSPTCKTQTGKGRMTGGMLTLQVSQARKSLLQSMLAQLRCGSSGSPPHKAQLVAAGNFSGAEPSSLPAHTALTAAVLGNGYSRNFTSWQHDIDATRMTGPGRGT